jgi:glycyl-tRNA synthetase
MVDFEELTTFMQSKGFVYGPEPSIYGGSSGFYTYGPAGKLLKNNIENAIRRVFMKHDFWEVECPIVMPTRVWEASGHLSGFTDPLVSCSNTKCGSNFRVDKLIFDVDPKAKVKKSQYLDFLKKNNVKCTSCGSNLNMELKEHDLMMKTKVGIDTEAYNRPETATTTYLPFPNYLNFFRDKLPFGIFQIGKAFRNEISPRQFIIRMREFTQAEGQLFIFGEEKADFSRFESVKKKKLPFLKANSKVVSHLTLSSAIKNKVLKSEAYAWTLSTAFDLFVEMGIDPKKIRIRQHDEDEMAFYADDAWDIEINLNSLGWEEFCGIHDRTDYDLKQHEKFSKTKLHAHSSNGKEHPHILEIAFGTDRSVMAVFDSAYNDDKKRGNKVLKFRPSIAPIQVGVFSLVNKLNDQTLPVYDLINDDFHCVFDKSGSIGRRYARADEQGIPYCITFDFDSIKGKDVTVRDRDSTKQVRVKIKKLSEVLGKLLREEIKFKDI